MIAELYGLPGSGKTTLVKALLEEPGDVFRKKRKTKSVPLWQCGLFALTPEFWGFCSRCFRIWRSKKAKWKDDGQCVFMMLKLYLAAMRERTLQDPHYYCTDHGLIQCILALIWREWQLKEDGLELADYILRHVGAGMLLVYVRHQQVDDIYNRIVQRGESRRITRLLEPAEGLEVLQFQADFFEEVGKLAEKYNKGVVVSTEQPLAESVTELRNCLLKRMG